MWGTDYAAGRDAGVGIDAGTLWVRSARQLEAWAGVIFRYGLAVVLVYFGLFKFTDFEAHAIAPLMESSPLFSWLYALTSLRGASNVIGVVEVVTGVLLAVQRWSPRLSVVGGLLGVATFGSTLTFLVTTPGAWERVEDFPVLGPNLVSGFLLKDVFLLGASMWATADSLNGALRRTRTSSPADP